MQMQEDDKQIEESGEQEEANVVLTQDELVELIHEVETIQTIQTIQLIEQFSGPIAHPEHMRQYKDIDESLPNRLVGMAESNLAHKQSIEKIAVIGQLLMAFLGWATPTGIAFYVLYHAVSFIQRGKSVEALVALVAALAALGGAFYMKQKDKDK
ncbi:MAG: hypothetical protein Q8R58_07820 [Sulfuricurvum sp.]|nr:hypothetical protein [Sulfuricurvum sp.]